MDSTFLPSSHRSRLLLVAAAVGFLVFYARLWPTAPYIAGDTGAYMEFARQIESGPWTAPSDRMPGYSLVLIVTGATQTPTRALYFVQLIAHFIGVWLLASIARTISRRGWIPLALVLLLPPFVGSAAIALTETVATLFVCAMTYGFWRQTQRLDDVRWAWFAGTACALAFLVRPVFLLLGPAVAVFAIFLIPARSFSRRVMIGLGFALPCVLAGAGWIGVNYVKFDYAGLTPKTGYMLFTRTLAFLERIPDEDAEIRELLIQERDKNLVTRNSSHTGAMFMWDAGEAQVLRATGSTREDLSSRMLRLNLRLIASAPLDYFSTVVRSVASGFTGVPFPGVGNLSSRVWQFIFVALWFALLLTYLLALCWFIATTCTLLARRFGFRVAQWGVVAENPGIVMPYFGLALFLHLTLWYNAIVSSAVEVGDPRHNLPCVPLLALAAFMFGAQWTRRPAVAVERRLRPMMSVESLARWRAAGNVERRRA